MKFSTRMGSYAVRASLVGVLALGPVAAAVMPQTAQAQQSDEIRAELEQVMNRLYDLQHEAENCYYDLQQTEANLQEIQEALVETEGQIENTTAEIDVTRADLAVAQEQLKEIVADDYKSGSASLLSIVLGATDFGDFVSRVTYVSKISAYKTEVVTTVKDLQAQLDSQLSELEEQKTTQEAQKAEQEVLVEEQRDRTAAAESAVAATETYRNSLSAELQQALAEEEEARRQAALAAAEEERRALEAATAQQQAEEQNQEQEPQQQEQQTQDEQPQQQEQQTQEEQPQQQEQQTQTSQPSQQQSTSQAPAVVPPAETSITPARAASIETMIARAESAIGSRWVLSGYVWTGNPASSQFTCSGLVDFALGYPSRAHWPESFYSIVGSGMKYSVSELNRGDLVFYYYGGRAPGHIGIYVGGGKIIDAAGYGVQYRDVNYMSFIGGGPWPYF